MKLYTKTGDDGTTGLFGGQRVSKDSVRVEAYGTVDEANAVLGAAFSVCTDDQLKTILLQLMSKMLDLGADLASPVSEREKATPRARRLKKEDYEQLEKWIDELEKKNPPLRNFILPAGSPLAAQLHVARSIVRRAERRVVTLADREPVEETVIIFLNRLSDLLFAMARNANRSAGVQDLP